MVNTAFRFFPNSEVNRERKYMEDMFQMKIILPDLKPMLRIGPLLLLKFIFAILFLLFLANSWRSDKTGDIQSFVTAA
jgi:hypothetical protein